MIPSVKTIETRLSVSHEAAVSIRKLMESFTRKYKSPTIPRNTLAKISSILNYFGVEEIAEGSNKKSPAILYCNSGDFYVPTVMYVEGKFCVGCVGDIVERGNYQ